MYMYIYSVSRFTRLCFQDVRVTWRQAFTIEVFMSLKQRWNQLKLLEGKHGDAAADLGLDMQSFTQAR